MELDGATSTPDTLIVDGRHGEPVAALLRRALVATAAAVARSRAA